MQKSDLADDPTCVIKILNEFRSRNPSSRHSNLIESRPSVLAPTRLLFDDSLTASDIKKRKYSESFSLTSPNISTGDNVEPNDSVEIPASPWDVRRLKADVLEAKTQIVSLENQIQKLHALRKETELLFENEKLTLMKQQERDRETIRVLEERMKVLRKREQEYKEELLQCKQSIISNKFSSEKKILSLQKENAQLEEKIKQLEHTAQKEFSNGERTISELEVELTLSTEELRALKCTTKSLEEKVVEVTHLKHQIEAAEQQLMEAKMKIKELELDSANTKDTKDLLDKQVENLKRLPEIEQEVLLLREDNRNLKDAVHNKLILEEEVMDLRARQARFEECELQLVQFKTAKEHLESVLEQWHKLARDHCIGVSPERAVVGPELLRMRIETLQQKELILTADMSSLESKLKVLQHAKDKLDGELDKAVKQVEKQQNVNEQQSSLIKRLQKKLLLVSRERDSYRSQLDMYEKELTVTSAASSLNSQQQQQKLRIDALEKTVEGYRELVEKMETDQDKTSKVLGGSPVLNERIKKLVEERDVLLQEKEELQKRRDELEVELEYRALKGDFNPLKSRVLHLRMNPAAEAEARRENELSVLQQECDRLRERLRVLEEGRTEDVTEAVNLRLATCNAQEVQELRAKVESYETKNQRLKEIFKATSQEFRDVCYILLGFRIDRVKPKYYRLSSMYAESEDDHLMFKISDGNPELLETPYSATLGELISLHLQHQHSIPMFLSSITLELFNRQTFCSTMEPVELE